MAVVVFKGCTGLCSFVDGLEHESEAYTVTSEGNEGDAYPEPAGFKPHNRVGHEPKGENYRRRQQNDVEEGPTPAVTRKGKRLANGVDGREDKPEPHGIDKDGGQDRQRQEIQPYAAHKFQDTHGQAPAPVVVAVSVGDGVREVHDTRDHKDAGKEDCKNGKGGERRTEAPHSQCDAQ